MIARKESKAKRIRPQFHLLILIVAFSLILFLIGLIMRAGVKYPNDKLRNTPAVAVPFASMIDRTLLKPYLPESTTGSILPPLTTSFKNPVLEPHKTRRLGPPEDPESYFDDALFIGDSRTVGLAFYRIEGADYFCSVGMSTYNLFDEVCSDEDYENMDLKTLLAERRYKRIYLMLGINELGIGVDSVCNNLSSVVQTIRNLKPNADLILMANLQITQNMSSKSSYLTMENIAAVNRYMESLADNTYIFYLDVNPLYCKESGYLDEQYTSDGCHPYGRYYEEWNEFIKLNAA